MCEENERAMKVINNLQAGRDHGARIKALIAQSDELVFASPYLMSDFSPWFSELDLGLLERFHLITTLQPNTIDQLSKVNALVSFIECASTSEKHWKFEISLNNRLHGKVFLFKRNGAVHTAILTSANLTNNGLRNNHEWGVEINESEHLHKVEMDLLSAIQYKRLTESEIYERQAIANAYSQQHPVFGEESLELDLTEGLKPDWFKPQAIPSVFFKPIGSSDEPVDDDWVFNAGYDQLDFSRKRPNSVHPGDIVVAYASGTGRLLSVFEVSSTPKLSTDTEIEQHSWKTRWPWYVKAKNLTPRFGTTWNQHHITTTMLKDQYLLEHPEGAISAAGGTTLGAFSFGADRLQLSAEFGRYVIQQLEAMVGKNVEPGLAQITERLTSRMSGTLAE